jgi:hypothetical protein
MTSRLSFAGQLTLILAMTLGRLVPLAILMRYLHDPAREVQPRFLLPHMPEQVERPAAAATTG